MEEGPHRHPAQTRSLSPDRPTVRPTLGRPLRNPGQCPAQPLRILAARPVGDRRRCLHVPDEGREPLLLSARLVHPSATPRGASAAVNDNSGRPRLASSMAARPQPDANRPPSPPTDRLHEKHRLDPPELDSNMFQDLRFVCQALGHPQGYIDSVVGPLKKTFATQWKHYKEWCLEAGVHPWLSFDRTQVTIELAREQLMAFLGYIKPSMQSYSNFCNHKSAVAKAFRVAFGFELGTDVFISQWIKGWKIELPPKPRHDPDEEGWDVGLIVEYWSTQLDNNELSTVELGYKALSLFSVSVYPRVSDLARLARDKLDLSLATSMRFRHFGTKELRSVPVFTRQTGISRWAHLRVCPVLAIKAYVDRTSSSKYVHSDPVYPFQHVFMSQVPYRATGLHFPVGSQTCSRWLRTIMTRIGIDPKYKGGSIRMAAASAAIDRGVPIDVVLNTGRWASWQVFNKFYNRSRLQASAPSIGSTSLA